MNRFSTLLLVVLLAIASDTAWARTVSESQAQKIAADFMTRHAMPASTLRIAKKAPRLNAASSNVAYYVFNASRGYVIVAGDDRAPAVLGYSEQGTFDTQNIPEAMQELLDSYNEQIVALSNGDKAAPATTSGPAIQPLLHSTWSQKSPYNHLLPFVNGNRAVVGCAATAMAQVMYYWKWPVRPTTTIPEYTTSSYSILMPALSPVNFNWDAMQDSYLYSDTLSEAGQAAATLSLYCAQALEMNFQDGTSGATTSRSPWVLSTYFGYKGSAHTLWRFNYTTQEWADMIYQELAANRPVIYSGSKKSGGHAFICDGYDGEGLFHINWGWNGQSNGYFLLNVLNADIQGTGSASGAYGYIYSQAAIVGIEPGEGSSTFALTATDFVLKSATTTRSGSSYDFRAYVTGRFRNLTSQVFAVSYGWALYQGSTFKKMLYETYSTSLRPGNYLTLSDKSLKFGSGLANGTYRILPVYSEYYAGNWRPCIGADKNYLEVVINGNSCTITGYGSASALDYTVNDITTEGLLHNGRPVDINVNLTNNGKWSSRLLYMFVDGTFKATGMVDLGTGETGDIPYRFMTADAGTYTLTWSWNDDGSDPIATRTLTINPMPTASLSATAEVLNVTDASNHIITSDKFSLKLTITNTGSTTYHEDISMKLYKNIYDNTGTSVQGKNQVITLEPGESTIVQFDMDNVVDGWRYFGNVKYYSAGQEAELFRTQLYTIVFPEPQQAMMGDVNGDGIINISDATALTNHLLGSTVSPFVEANADMVQDGILNITDLTNLINYLLNNP